MFTKADYQDYFAQLARIERKMIYNTYDLSLELKDPLLVRTLQKIGDDEVRHYGYVRKMLQELGAKDDHERRQAKRKWALGKIALQPDVSAAKTQITGNCVNLSATGVCLETSQEIASKEMSGLTITLFDQKDPLIKEGKVVWSKKVEDGLWISGMEFKKEPC